MKRINLRTGFVIIAIYEILYLVYAELGSGINELLMYHTHKIFMWTVIVPVAAIAIYFLIRWASKKKQ